MENVIREVKMNLPSSKLSLKQAQEIISKIFPAFFCFKLSHQIKERHLKRKNARERKTLPLSLSFLKQE